MKILMLSEFSEDGTSASFSLKRLTAKKIAEKGHQVTLVHPSCSFQTTLETKTDKHFTEISTPGLFSKRLRSGGFGVLDALFKSIFALKTRYDVILTTSGHRPGALFPALLGKYFRGSVIVDEWWEWFGKGGYASLRKGILGKIVNYYDIILELPTKGLYDGVIAITNALKNRLEVNNHVIVLHGGAECDKFVEYSLAYARKNLNIEKDLFIIGMSNIGKVDHDDNAVFLEAFKKLSEEYDYLRLFVTGERKYIEDFLKHQSYGCKVLYSGWLDFVDYNKHLSACDLFVLPFRNHPRNVGRWPNKLGDYLCLNRPIISNPTGELKKLFFEYKIGLLCEPTVESYCSILRRILEDKLHTSLLCGDSKQLALILSIDRRIDKMTQFYEWLMGERVGKTSFTQF